MKQLTRNINGITYYCVTIGDYETAKKSRDAAKYAGYKARIIALKSRNINRAYGCFVG